MPKFKSLIIILFLVGCVKPDKLPSETPAPTNAAVQQPSLEPNIPEQQSNDSSQATPEVVRTYPIIIAHGLLGSGGLFGLKSLKNKFIDKGFNTYLAEVSAAHSIEIRAEALWEQAEEILAKHQAKKIILIGHSMGGLDARYLAHDSKRGENVASVISISTPHFGSPIADSSIKILADSRLDFLVKISEFVAKTYNSSSKQIDMKEALKNLSSDYMHQFNIDITNNKKVRYASFAASIKKENINKKMHIFLRKSFNDMEKLGYKSDGLVPEFSQKWGSFLGSYPLDHLAIAGTGQAKFIDDGLNQDMVDKAVEFLEDKL